MPKALLLDSIKPIAAETFEGAGFEVDTFPKSLSQDELITRLDGVAVLGIRSGPKVPAEIVQASSDLLAIGCYGVGTDHVDKSTATQEGIAVFNSPYDNGRSVAELVIGSTYSLMRRLHEHNIALHEGRWTKTDSASYELRRKTMGVIGFGNIGQQVAHLAEANGMNVVFYDPQDQPRLGNAKKASSLETLLGLADVITVHVPGGLAKPVIGEEQLRLMKPGAALINTSRAGAVDYKALLSMIRTGHIGAAALDVFPNEPASNQEEFVSELSTEPRVLLTPHIGGSTQEAQNDAAESVTHKLIKYSSLGTSTGAVNLPGVDLGEAPEGTRRITHIHHNRPGADAEMADRMTGYALNIAEHHVKAQEDIGYGLFNIEVAGDFDVNELKLALSGSFQHAIRTRIL